MAIQERILQYIEINGITPYKFCKDLGFSMGYLDKRGAIGTDKYLKIIEHYADINPKWLLTGQGEMLRTGTAKEVTPQPLAPSNDLTIQLIRENGNLERQLGEQVNENKHLHKENMLLKAEIERLKNAGNVPKEYDFYKPELMMVAEKQAEYSKSNK